MDSKLDIREKKAEEAMYHICTELYNIDRPNHAVKDGYRIGFEEGYRYAIDSIRNLLEDIDFEFEYHYSEDGFTSFEKEKFINNLMDKMK